MSFLNLHSWTWLIYGFFMVLFPLICSVRQVSYLSIYGGLTSRTGFVLGFFLLLLLAFLCFNLLTLWPDLHQVNISMYIYFADFFMSRFVLSNWCWKLHAFLFIFSADYSPISSFLPWVRETHCGTSNIHPLTKYYNR